MYMKRIIIILFLLMGIFFCGCSKPELTRRYKEAEWKEAQTFDGRVKMSAFVMDAPGDAPKSILEELTPPGQAAFIVAIEKNTQDVNEFIQKIAGKLRKIPDKNAISDTTQLKKRIVFTIEKDMTTRPADRIQEIQVILSEIMNGSFASWNRISTKYETVDLGKVSLTKGVQSELGLSIGPKEGSSLPRYILPTR